MLIIFWLSQTWPVTLRIQEKVFFGCTAPVNSKEIELGRSHQEAFPSAGKNAMVVLVPCHAWKCDLTANSDISEVPGCHFLWQMSSPWGSLHLKIISRIGGVSWTHNLPFCFWHIWIMAILSKGCKPDNSLKLSFTIIWVLCSNFVECESLFESNAWHSGSA